MPRVITYGCSHCGTEVLVTGTVVSNLSPIYCCGMEVTEISSYEEKPESESTEFQGTGEIPEEKEQKAEPKSQEKPEKPKKKRAAVKVSAKASAKAPGKSAVKKKGPAAGKKRAAQKTMSR